MQRGAAVGGMHFIISAAVSPLLFLSISSKVFTQKKRLKYSRVHNMRASQVTFTLCTQ